MLKAVVGARAPLELWPGPWRMLLIGVSDDDGMLKASVSVGGPEGTLDVLSVMAGDEIRFDRRRFKVTAAHMEGLHGDRIDLEEIRTFGAAGVEDGQAEAPAAGASVAPGRVAAAPSAPASE